jgi:prepilin signal peptidase PulO-like enzyme (type II secretory pathway)
MSYLFLIFIFLFGLCIGSFLNCAIYRLEQKKNLKGRSFCPNCKHQLSWKDLVPVFSFLFLKGKCRYCQKKISIQYPLVEISTGIVFLLVANYNAKCFARVLGNSDCIMTTASIFSLAFLFYIASVLIAIFVYDLKHYIIPDKILLPAIVVAFFYGLFDPKFTILNLLGATIISSGFFLFIFLISKGRWMGFGDVKLAVLMGFLLGFPNVLVALFLAFFFGAVIGAILMFFGKKGLKSEIPFGPFLITGTFVALFWGQNIINWYLTSFNI